MYKELSLVSILFAVLLSIPILYYFGYGILSVLAIITLMVTFYSTLFVTGVWIKIARNANILGKDINKKDGGKVAESGGMSVILGLTFGILFYVFIKTFFITSDTNLINVLVIVITILLASILGFIDDIIGWKIGLKQWQKPLLTIPIAIPLMVINAGSSVVDIPFLGLVDLGLFYPLLIIPIGLIGAANGFNMLAGLNGLEAGLGAIILTTMGIFAYTSGFYWLTVLVAISVVSLLAFLVYNKYPSKVFPGDSLTYSIGALIASVAIMGNMQKVALILFIPYFIEFVLKAKTRFKGESFGIAQEDGKLKSPEKIKSMTHVSMRLLEKIKGHATEKSAVYMLYLIQILLSILVLTMWL